MKPKEIAEKVADKLVQFGHWYPGCFTNDPVELDHGELQMYILSKLTRPRFNQLAEQLGLDPEPVIKQFVFHANTNAPTETRDEIAMANRIAFDAIYYGALQAWRPQKLIYFVPKDLSNFIGAQNAFHPSFVYQEEERTVVELTSLVNIPERCIYIAFEDFVNIQGFFVFPYKNENGDYIITIFLDLLDDPGGVPLVILIDCAKGPTLQEATGITDAERLRWAHTFVHFALHTQSIPYMMLRNSRTGQEHRPRKPTVTRTRRGLRVFPANKPTIIDMSYKEGMRPGLIEPPTAARTLGTGHQHSYEYPVGKFQRWQWVGQGEYKHQELRWVSPHTRGKGRGPAPIPTVKKL